MEYERTIRELEGVLESPPGAPHFLVYNFLSSSSEHMIRQYGSFYAFAMETWRQAWSAFVGSPFYLYYFESREFNAYAMRQSNGMNLIGVSNTLFEGLAWKASDAGTRLTEVSKRMRIDVPSLLTVPIDYYIFLFSRHFLFYHELAHLIQLKGYYKNCVRENARLSGRSNYKVLSHVMERDADIIAANACMDQLLTHFNGLPVAQKSAENLEDLVALALVGAYFLFDLVSHGLNEPIYFYESTHPHTTIRINCLIRTMVNKTAIVQNWPTMNIMRTTQKFLDIVEKVTDISGKRRFLAVMNNKGDQVFKYEVDIHSRLSALDWSASRILSSAFGEIDFTK